MGGGEGELEVGVGEGWVGVEGGTLASGSVMSELLVQ